MFLILGETMLQIVIAPEEQMDLKTYGILGSGFVLAACMMCVCIFCEVWKGETVVTRIYLSDGSLA